MIKCVVFDFDGTLVESNEIKRQTFYKVTKDISGADLMLDNLFSMSDSGDRYSIFSALISGLKKRNNLNISASYLSNVYTKICENEISKAPEVPGALSTLQELKKRKIKLFLSSATPVDTLQRIVSMRGWGEIFEGVMGSPKSKEDHLKLILSSNNYSLSEVVYVGDSEVDQEASLFVGCKFIGIGSDYSRFKSRPTVLLSTLKKLTKELEL